MNGIEKFERNEKICNAFYTYNGDVLAIAKELAIDVKLVRKVVAELKKKMDKDVKFNLASLIMMKICSGHNQIEHTLGPALSALTEHATFEGSLCCGRRIYVREEGMKLQKYCGKCNKPINATQLMPNLPIFRMMLDFGKQLDVHYELLVKFAKEMGFTASEGTTLIRQNNVIIADVNSMPSPDDLLNIDPSLLKDIDKLSPQERRSLSQKILRKVVESKVVEEG